MELFVLCVEDDGELIALAPWYIESFPLHGRVVQFLGSGPVCTDYMSVLCKPGWEETKSAKALARWLSVEANQVGHESGWNQIELEGIDSLVPATRIMQHAWPTSWYGADRWCIAGRECPAGAWRCPATGTNTCAEGCPRSPPPARSCRQLALGECSIRAGETTLRTARSESELDEGWRTLIDLHQRRRRSLGDPGCFAAPRFEQFHRDVVRRLLPSGQLRLHWLELDGEPIAAEYHLAGDNGVIYAYQSGIEIDALGVAPGRLITLAILRARRLPKAIAASTCCAATNRTRCTGAPSLGRRLRSACCPAKAPTAFAMGCGWPATRCGVGSAVVRKKVCRPRRRTNTQSPWLSEALPVQAEISGSFPGCKLKWHPAP